MSIVLEIQDGPPPSYLTSKIRVRATPNASDPEISPIENTTNYLFVEVKNNGTEDAIGCVCNTTGPFVAPQVIAPSGGNVAGSSYFSQNAGNSPTGNVKVVISKDLTTGQILDVALVKTSQPNSGGFWHSGAIQQGESAGWGFSPDGRFFLFARSGGHQASIGVAEGTGQGSTIWSSTFASSSGWGFSPDGGTFAFVDQYVTLHDLSRPGAPVIVSNLNSGYAQFRFSPCGDLFVFVPSTIGSQVAFYKLPARYPAPAQSGPWNPTVSGVSQPITLTGTANPSLTVTGPGALGIALTGMSNLAIDNPICMYSNGLVKVDTWGYVSSTYMPRSASSKVGSGYVDLPRASTPGAVREALIAPAWNPTWLGHSCLFAETYTLDGRDPQPSQTLDFQVVARRQVAQRNVMVVAPKCEYFLFPFQTTNPDRERRDITMAVERIDHTSDEWRSDLLLGGLPKESFESRFGLTTYRILHAVDDSEVSEKLDLALEPGETATLALWFENPNPDADAVQAFLITEFRGGEAVGRIVVAGYTRAEGWHGLRVEPPPAPCPVELQGPVAGATQALGGHLVAVSAERLIASFVNPTTDTLKDVTVYLEGVSSAQANVEPLRISAGDLGPGDSISGQWRVDLSSTSAGDYFASFVVQDAAHSFKRIIGDFAVDPPLITEWIWSDAFNRYGLGPIVPELFADELGLLAEGPR